MKETIDRFHYYFQPYMDIVSQHQINVQNYMSQTNKLCVNGLMTLKSELVLE